jgi:hypothetical protein
MYFNNFIPALNWISSEIKQIVECCDTKW